MRGTHTYVVLEISPEAFDEIAEKLRAAGYNQAFMPDGEIDMHGIAVKSDGGQSSLKLGAAAREVDRRAKQGNYPD